MKKLFILIVCVVLTLVSVKGQVSVSGDVGFYTKNLSTFTGLMFSEDAAMVSHLNTNLELKDFSLTASYSGHHGVQNLQDGDHFNMVDLFLSYKVSKELSVSAGYELTYTDNKDSKDEIGHGVFAMATWSNEKLTSNFIFFADPTFKSTYYIASVDVKVGKNVNLYSLGGYTNTKANPWYGLIGPKYSKDAISIGTCWVFGDNPGPVFYIQWNF